VPETPPSAPEAREDREVEGPRLTTSGQTRAWGARLAALLRAGDLVVLTGGLGAGKTTLTQGIGQGLGIRGPVTSPTFVIARVHPSLVDGPALVHVDAYRLGGFAELDDLDLDATLDDSVTIVEWGHGLAEDLTDDRLEVLLDGEDVRSVRVVPHGARWAGVDLTTLTHPVPLPVLGPADDVPGDDLPDDSPPDDRPADDSPADDTTEEAP
jgi:tRNA threonylcarbamoyladenosine biosynthesis protein TsaE